MKAEGDAAGDPYQLLGVEPAASAAIIKKRYWRLSLMIHPDKCSHTLAHAAFDAVAQAAKALQVQQSQQPCPVQYRVPFVTACCLANVLSMRLLSQLWSCLQ